MDRVSVRLQTMRKFEVMFSNKLHEQQQLQHVPLGFQFRHESIGPYLVLSYDLQVLNIEQDTT